MISLAADGARFITGNIGDGTVATTVPSTSYQGPIPVCRKDGVAPELDRKRRERQ